MDKECIHDLDNLHVDRHGNTKTVCKNCPGDSFLGNIKNLKESIYYDILKNRHLVKLLRASSVAPTDEGK